MDANLQRPFVLADEAHWMRPGEPPGLHYDATRKVLRLASTRRAPAWQEDRDRAVSLVEQTPGSIDRFGTRARWDAGGRQVVATGAFPDEVAIYTPPANLLVHDVAIGHDDVLYLAAGRAVVLKDLRDRWPPVELAVAPGFNAWRLAPIPSGGVFCLDRAAGHIGRITGLPHRPRNAFAFSPETFRPREEDPDPPRGEVLGGATWPAQERPVAIHCSPEGKLALLTWVTGADAHLRLLGEDGRFEPPVRLRGVRTPYALRWLGRDQVALLIARSDTTGADESPVFPLPTGARVVDPVGDVYPLRGLSASRADRPLDRWPQLLHGTRSQPEYLTPEGARPLVPISWPSFAAVGEARNAPAHRVIDGGEVHTVWHRLYLEAAIPPGCGVKVLLATTGEPIEPDAAAVWHEHHFGTVTEDPLPGVPRGVWLPQPSEIPFHPGLLPCERRPHRSGLWTALIQRPQFRVRSLVGRYLWVRLELHGDGRSTPEVAALRAYGGRRSYVKSYLPELYHEQLFGPEADAHSPEVSATPADFLERFLGNFEGILTPIEDRIKHAWLLTDPASAPEEALEWLASWIGFTFAPAVPAERRRDLLAHGMELYRRRGTLDGLRLALDLATGGGVQGGEIVVFEDFRLRRTFATILGANLAEADDPLVPGLSVSGNSFVGDTLFLGDENNKEFLALFSANLPVTSAEAASIAQLFNRLAHRATVLVHNEVEPQDLGLIRQVVEREAPAHVAVQILTASHRFLVGMSSLVGVDTYLARRPDTRPVRVDHSEIGRRDLIEHLPSLDPRLGHGPAAPPVARLSTVDDPELGAPFSLDGSSSRAAPGRRLVRYRWTLRR